MKRSNLGLRRRGFVTYALVAMLFFVPVTINAGWPGQTTTYVFFAAMGLAVVGRLSRVLRGQQSIGQSAWILLLLLPIMAAGLVHETGPAGWLTMARPLIVLVLVVWHVHAESKLDPELIRRIAVMVAWAAPALVLLAAYQRITGSWPVLDQLASSKSYTSKGDPTRTAAIMGHPILYGAYSMVAAVVSAALKPKYWKLLLVAALLGLLLSGARSAWVGAALALLLLFISRRPRLTFWGLYSGLITAAALVFAMAAFPQAVDAVWGAAVGRLDNVTESASALARNLRVMLAWDQITNSDDTWWWGLGPGALAAYFAVATVKDNLAATFDNSYLSLWFEYGAIAVATFGLVALATVMFRGAATGRLLMLAILAQIAFFDFFQWPLMIGAIALAVGLRQEERLPTPEEDLPESRQLVIPFEPGRPPHVST